MSSSKRKLTEDDSSADATADAGKRFARYCTRGITMSRAAFSVFCGYHPQSIPKVNQFGIDGFDSSGLESFFSPANYSNLLKDSYNGLLKTLKRPVKETELTKELHARLLKDYTVQINAPVGDKEGKVDLLFHKITRK
jgi:hypothetical protein